MEEFHDVEIAAEIVEIALDPQSELEVLVFELIGFADAGLREKQTEEGGYFEERTNRNGTRQRIHRIS